MNHISAGTARRLGIRRPLPVRQFTRAEREQLQSQGLSQLLRGATSFVKQPNLVTEIPVPTLIEGEFWRRTCDHCGYWTEYHRWVTTPPVQHYCRRDEVTVLVLWPGRW